MINQKCLTSEWIDRKSEEFQYRDKNLIEKVIRALSLLDLLSGSGCPFVFKGGSSVMLTLADAKHRLSIDIDIMCPPGTNIEVYLKHVQDCGFLRYELIERVQAGTNIPKNHSKFYYQLAFPSANREEDHILLDVLYEDCHYVQTEWLPIQHPLIACVGEPLKVQVPSVGDMLGDKMTAFAPDTTGIPYYKKGQVKAVEIIKQLYDIGRLFEHVEVLDVTSQAFRAIAPVEMGYRGLTGDSGVIAEDVRQTALNIATRGWVDKEKFGILQTGINNIRPFMYQARYVLEDAIVDASRAAYLVTLVENGKTELEKFPGDATVVAEMVLAETVTNKLNKLRKTLPEAYWYWCKVGELLE